MLIALLINRPFNTHLLLIFPIVNKDFAFLIITSLLISKIVKVFPKFRL